MTAIKQQVYPWKCLWQAIGSLPLVIARRTMDYVNIITLPRKEKKRKQAINRLSARFKCHMLFSDFIFHLL